MTVHSIGKKNVYQNQNDDDGNIGKILKIMRIRATREVIRFVFELKQTRNYWSAYFEDGKSARWDQVTYCQPFYDCLLGIPPVIQ